MEDYWIVRKYKDGKKTRYQVTGFEYAKEELINEAVDMLNKSERIKSVHLENHWGKILYSFINKT